MILSWVGFRSVGKSLTVLELFARLRLAVEFGSEGLIGLAYSLADL